MRVLAHRIFNSYSNGHGVLLGPRPPMVTQRIFNTRLLTYLVISCLHIYVLPVYLLIYLLPNYLLTYYLLIYLHLTATLLFFPRCGNFVRATIAKPRGRSITVLSCTIQCRRLLNMVQF